MQPIDRLLVNGSTTATASVPVRGCGNKLV